MGQQHCRSERKHAVLMRLQLLAMALLFSVHPCLPAILMAHTCYARRDTICALFSCCCGDALGRLHFVTICYGTSSMWVRRNFGNRAASRKFEKRFLAALSHCRLGCSST
jgi:hypothetical protein